MRFFLTIEYEGTNFVGWQKQNSGPSIQEKIEDCIYKITQVKGSIYGSGRTDAGVHSKGQV
jgi:tRNA pseudouridine38-40 synthase